MYQVNILDSNYYPVRQVCVTNNKASATARANELKLKGKLVGIMYFD